MPHRGVGLDLSTSEIDVVYPAKGLRGLGSVSKVSGRLPMYIPYLEHDDAHELEHPAHQVEARNEFICWVEDAKQEMTRERRIRRTQEELEEGQRRPCCWPGCKNRERTGR